ncbi:MAG: hypothetical protein M3Q33_14490 [Acidobacteriota bacterium]|nr:hypothetical protein [Acidobacteriota bacterium]
MKSASWNVQSPLVLFSVIALICLFGLTFDTNAQTKRRKRTTTTVTQPTPPPIGVPIIISRAEDIPSETQIIVPETQPESEPNLEDKIDNANSGIKELKTRVKSLESTKRNEYDEKQKRLLLNLDILSRAEQRAENLRKQLYELIEKESTLKARIEQIDSDTRPEMIERSIALVGTLHPEELRDVRRKNLQAEKLNLEKLLAQIESNRTNLESNVQKSDALVEKLRTKLEKDIDDALTEEN